MSQANFRVGYSIPNDDDYAIARLGPHLDEAAALRVDTVELAIYAMDLVANGRMLRDRVARVKALTAGRPFGYTIHGPLHLNLMERPSGLGIHKDVLKATLEIAAELGGVHCVAHAGSIPPEANADAANAALARQRQALAEVADFAAAHGITIVVENLFSAGERALLPSRLAAEIAAIGHPAVKACLDFSHGALLCAMRGADFLEEAAALAPYAPHLHIHDSFAKPGARTGYRAERLAYGTGDLHLPLGLGSLPWDALMERCRFPAGAIFINELAPDYWTDLAVTVEQTRALAAKARVAEAS